MTDDRNFYWLAGDRYVCVCRKNDIIGDYKKLGEWDIVSFSTTDPDVFASTINKQALFGDKKTIFVHDGSVPEPAKTMGFIEKLKKTKVLIVLEGDPEDYNDSKVDKRSVMYKKFKDQLEDFPIVMQSNGYPDKNLIPVAINIIKMITQTNINEKILKELFENSGYDIGRTVNEIEKIDVYVGDKKIKSLDDVKLILSQKGDPTIDKIKNYLNKGELPNAFKEANWVMDNFDIYKLFMGLFGAIIDNFTYVMYCKLAISSGCKTPKDIGLFISEHWIKNDKKVDANTAERRYYFYKDTVERLELKNILHILKLADIATQNFIMKRATPRFLVNFFLRDISDLI